MFTKNISSKVYFTLYNDHYTSVSFRVAVFIFSFLYMYM